MDELRKLLSWHPPRKLLTWTKPYWKEQKLPTYFNGSVAKKWLRNCRKYHSRSHCRVPDQATFELFVIDCTTREVHRHNFSNSYVALSYVWGGVSQPPIQVGKVPLDASAVIMDAMEVTKKIGFRYLWVDQYCIEQTDHDARASQLANMHLVYSQAEVTIVAACGINANGGLPGVSQPRYECDDRNCPTKLESLWRSPYMFLSTAVRKISGSKWSTRGWTFQEARLSRRLLCFTEEQCYWECHTMSCMELLSLNAEVWKAHEGVGYCEVFYCDISSGLPFGPRSHSAKPSFGTPGDYMTAVCELISEYTLREISYDEDVIFAMMGVVEAVNVLLSQVSGGIFRPITVMGLPIIISGPVEARQQSLVCALLWYHRDNRQIVRRQKFPSWTWAGWKGQAFFHDGWFPIDIRRLHGCEAEFYVTDAQFTTTEDREKRIVLEDMKCTTEVAILHVTAPEIPSHWLVFRPHMSKSKGSSYFLLDHPCCLEMSEITDAPQLLAGLETGLYRLVLVSYWAEKDLMGHKRYKGCIWILKQEGVYCVRSGIILLVFDHWDPHIETPRTNTPWKIQEGIAVLLQTASSIEWEIS